MRIGSPAPHAERVDPVPHVGAVLFGCTFAAQSALVTLTPIMEVLAAELRVSTAAVGELRAVSGAVAGAVALGLAAGRRRLDLRRVIATGLVLLAAGSAGSAVAVGFTTLAAAQGVLAIGLALTLAGGLAAAAAWVPLERRTRTLGTALAGQPAAWSLGLPVVGVVGGHGWRLAWLVPLAAATVSLLAVSARGPATHPAEPAGRLGFDSRPAVARWAAGEALAFAGWTGLLVYAGALLTDAYRISPGTTGLLLGLAALAHLAGNVVARRWLASAARTTVVLVLPAMAVTAVLLCAVRPSPAFSVTIFAVCCFLGGARTIAGSALGLSLGGTARLRAMGLRTAAVQFGYLLGAGLGGLGLALAGWPGLGMALGGLLLLATLAYTG